ncbi:MAG: hypothetical protein HYU66_20980, partial [Armatimonadetes bacterium]|nr:hypothetical protein [Armatimonadota bacterium]
MPFVMIALVGLLAGCAWCAPNLCLAGKLTASSEMPGYPVRWCADGLRSRDRSYWNDNTRAAFPDWVQVTWDRPQTIRVVRACLPFMPWHPEPVRRIGEVAVEYLDGDGTWQRIRPSNATPNPATDWLAPRGSDDDRPLVWRCEPITTTALRIVFLRGQADGWSLLDEIEAYEMDLPAEPPLRATLLTARPEPPPGAIFRIGRFDGAGGGLWQPERTLRDDGEYQNGGYWATPLAWLMTTLLPADPALAARTFCDAVDDFRSHDDVNEWVNEQAARPVGVRNYNASATMPLEGVRRLRAWLAEHGQTLPADLAKRLDDDETWLKAAARRIVRGSSREGKGGVRIFTPDATGGYGAFWVRDWSYSVEGCPEAFTREEVRNGYLFLAAAQRADGDMPDRVRPDGVGVFSPGGEQNPLSQHGSVDQSPFM